MHLDFQMEEHVCTETCDRINPVITIVFKTERVTALNLSYTSTHPHLPTHSFRYFTPPPPSPLFPDLFNEAPRALQAFRFMNTFILKSTI